MNTKYRTKLSATQVQTLEIVNAFM